MAVLNETILDQIRLQGTNDYQQRVPSATQAGVSAVQEALFDPTNRDLYNQFVSGLINRIGMTILNTKRWDNPLAQFKRGFLQAGDTIQEIGNNLIKAHSYSLDGEDLLKINRPESKAAYHTVNREDRYDISINEVELRKAFIDQYGLNTYISSILDIPLNSDNYDEYQIMKQLFAEYKAKHGYYQVQVANLADAVEADAKTFIKLVRAYTGKLKFLSAQYNAMKLPVFANPEELVLFTTPEAIANIDVNVLAAAFNVSYAEVQNRVVVLDEFPMENTQAILASRDFFLCADYVYRTDSFYNGKNLTTNYFLHHWGVYSVSPFMPVIEFTTDASSTIPTIAEAVTGITGEFYIDGATATTATRAQVNAGEVSFVATLEGTITPDNENVVVAPNSVVYDGFTLSTGDAVKKTTYIDREGILHVQAGFVGDIDVDFTATYTNPSDDSETAVSGTATIAITA